jgi:O-antigen/teichoic acid export membrane protein
MSLAIYVSPLLIAVDRPDLLLYFSLAETVINLGVAALTVKHGIVAMGYAYVVRSYLVVPLILYFASKVIGARWHQLLRLTAAPTLSALAMFGATYALRHALPLSPWPMLLALVSCGALVYLAGMWLFGRATLQRLLGMLQSLRGRGPGILQGSDHGE